MQKSFDFDIKCPLPLNDYRKVLLAHGGGGKLMRGLIKSMFAESFDNEYLAKMNDGAVLEMGDARYAFTTDSYVVDPVFFKGGNIGDLAVCGTLNDLAMCGAKPLFLSAGFILEEGFPMEKLWEIVQSMKRASERAGVVVVTGDTKVVDRGKGDGIYINTAGIGLVKSENEIAPSSIQTGDAIIVNGDIGKHGIAVMAEREGLSFETEIESDCADLSDLVMEMIDLGLEIHCMRDLTRGGLASALVEIAESAKKDIFIEETEIPVNQTVKSACELLGFDPIYVANEGRFLCFVPEDHVDETLNIMKQNDLGKEAVKIGRVGKIGTGSVTMKTVIGAARVVDMLSGEQLPRIC